MIGRLLCSSLVWLIVCAVGFGAELLPAQEPDKQEIEKLIAQLGSAAEYENATRRLAEIGTEAKPQIQAAIKGDDPLISRRAKLVLANIARREKAQRLRDLENQADREHDGAKLPGWKQFCEITGDSPESRRLFVEMNRAQPAMMQAYYSDFSKAKKLLNAQHSYVEGGFFNIKAKQLSLGSTAAILLVAGDERIGKEEHQRTTPSMYGLLGLDLHRVLEIFRQSEFDQRAKLTDDDRKRNKPLRKLIARWMRLPDGSFDPRDCAEQEIDFVLAMDYGVTEIIPFAAQLIRDKRTPSSLKCLAVIAIGQLGDKSHVHLLEPLLSDQKQASNPIAFSGLVCDLALGTLVEMTGQKLTDYKFTTTSDFAKRTTFPARISSVHFASQADREQALAKWDAWAKENLKAEEKNDVAPPAKAAGATG